MTQTLSISIAGNSVNFQPDSFTIQEVIGSSSCSFTVEDATGTNHYTNRMPVVVTDSVLGLLFAGFIDTPDETNLYPNANNEIAIQCVDNNILAKKRRVTKDYVGMAVGDIATDMLSNYLAVEGVTAGYAYRHVTTQSDWTYLSTLSNVVAALTDGDGDLELTPIGTNASWTDNTTTEWTAGTRVSMDGQNNQLNLHAYNAIKFTATNQGNLGNTSAYWQIWAGSDTIATNDVLNYDVWISSTSPQIMAGVDLVFSDGTRLRDNISFIDQWYIPAQPSTDLSGFANDQWYSRSIVIGGLAGKVINSVQIAFEGDNSGNYQAYFKNINRSNGGTIQTNYYDGTANPYNPGAVSLNSNQPITVVGYYNLNVSQLTVYDQSGSRISPAISIDAAKIVKSSLVAWTSVIPSNAVAGSASGNTPLIPANTTLAIYTSIDNQATWQACSFKGTIPNLYPGFDVAGRNLYTKVVMSITGTTPEVSPVLTSLLTTVTTSWNQTKTDSITTCTTSSDFNTGNYSNTQPLGSSKLSIIGAQQPWTVDMHGQTAFGSSSPTQVLIRKQFQLGNNGGGNDAQSRFDSGYWGNWQNFTYQVAVQLPNLSPAPQVGVTYRTTTWSNNNNTFAYTVMFDDTHIELGHGTNGGVNVYTLLSSVNFPAAISKGGFYTLKCVVWNSGTTVNHQIYLNNVLWINYAEASGAYQGAGQIGLRTYYGTSLTYQVLFDNMGIEAAQQGTWNNGTGINVNSIGTVGNSMIEWDAVVPTGASLLCQTSVDGGSTWQTATSGAAIPNLGPGISATGKHVKVQFTLTNADPTQIVILNGWTAWLTPQTNATGYRISPALSLANVGRAGSTLLTMNVICPTTGCTVSLDSSFDGSTWSNLAAVSISGTFTYAIPSIHTPSDPFLDFFAASDASNYTSQNYGSGANGTWTFDTANSRLVGSGGTRAVYTYTGLAWQDSFIEADFNYSDGGGLVGRMVDTTHLYYIVLNDASAASNPNTVQLFKRVAGTTTQLGTTQTISFTRGDYHRVRLSCQGTTIAVFIDNVQILSVTDSSVSSSGAWGFAAGNKIQAYSFRAQDYGDDVTSKSVYNWLTLTSTDPVNTPQVLDITTSVHNSNISNGATIPSTSWSQVGQNMAQVSQAMDDLVKQSATTRPWLWFINKNKQLFLHQDRAVAAPFYVWVGTNGPGSGNILFSDQVSKPKVSRPDMLYRNRQTVDGGYDTTSTLTEKRQGDGFTQSWSMAWPLASVPYITQPDPSISLTNQAATVGILGQDTGKDFYWSPGSNVISQDPSEIPPSLTDTISFTYVGQIPVRVTINNTGGFPGTVSQSQLAAIDGTSGIVEDYVSIPGLSSDAATLQANGLLQQYGFLGRDFTFATNWFGLAPGQLMLATYQAGGITNIPFLITQVTTTVTILTSGQLLYWFEVDATEGPNLGDWSVLFQKMLAAT